MKKIIAALLAAALLTACAGALAETYVDKGSAFSFEYDPDAFEIALEEYGEAPAMDLVLFLEAKNEDWGETDISFMRMSPDEELPLSAQIAELESSLNVKVEQGEWNGIGNVYMYGFEDEGFVEQNYIVLLDGGSTLDIGVVVERLDDEEASADRDDAISAVLDTLKILG